ncbi:MAG TPA: phosphatidylglycerophosphatase A [Spirochaetota bacterium]|nr:phosphatidylglycerophosphatase A [Spirochaetota bacterium]HPR48279.1 phosphatidylglycerophosphatase A [Spirochaetota bacterium]
MKFKEFLFTGFYSGYCPVAPGTMGTLVAMALYLIEYYFFRESSWIVNLIVVVLMLYPSIKLSDYGEIFFNKKDPSQVVIDEFMGYWISVLFYPFSLKIAVIAFIVFRIMDIIKPFPAGRLQKLRGGLGIMVDDCIAGLYTNIIILIIIIASRAFEYPIYMSR